MYKILASLEEITVFPAVHVPSVDCVSRVEAVNRYFESEGRVYTTEISILIPRETGSEDVRSVVKTTIDVPVPSLTPPVLSETITRKHEVPPLKGQQLDKILPCVCPYKELIKNAQMEIFDAFMTPFWIFNKLTAKKLVPKKAVMESINHYFLSVFKAKGEDRGAVTFPELSEEDRIVEIKGQPVDLSKVLPKCALDFAKAIDQVKESAKGTATKFDECIQDYFQSCAAEKKETGISVLETQERIMSGGCGLMVSALSLIMGVDEDLLYRSSFRGTLIQMMKAMAAANIHFNDPYSYYKEVAKEKDPIKEGDVESWIAEQLNLYHQQLALFYALKKEVGEKLSTGEYKESFVHQVKEYALLLESALSGVVLWSIDLTSRYDLTYKGKQPKELAVLFDELSEATAVDMMSFLEKMEALEKERGLIQTSTTVVTALREAEIPLTEDLDAIKIAGFFSTDPEKKAEALESILEYWGGQGVPQELIGPIIGNIIAQLLVLHTQGRLDRESVRSAFNTVDPQILPGLALVQQMRGAGINLSEMDLSGFNFG